ncbi:MAG: EAL domain-containing protein, partial [Caldilineaceae bacterium]|nr:EAL domain-containing protein [Caldilineaceae bacterium]
SFIDLINLGGQHVEIVRTIATLAQNLQLSVIAEGVETEEQLHYVEALGCEQVQGYLLSKPLDRVAAEAFVASSVSNHHLPIPHTSRQLGKASHYNYPSAVVAAGSSLNS